MKEIRNRLGYSEKLQYTPISPFSKKIIIDVNLEYSDKKNIDLLRMLRLLPFFLRPNKEWLLLELTRRKIIVDVIENFFDYYFYYIYCINKLLFNDSNHFNRIYKIFLKKLDNIFTVITLPEHEYIIYGIKDLNKNFDKFSYIVVLGKYKTDDNKIFINYSLLANSLNIPENLKNIEDAQILYNKLKREISKRTRLEEYLNTEAFIKFIRVWSHEFVHALQFIFYDLSKKIKPHHNALGIGFLDEDKIENVAKKISENVVKNFDRRIIKNLLSHLYEV